MRNAVLTKAALCVCPPVVLAGATTTVPVVRKAVHHATRPHRAPALVHKAAGPLTAIAKPLVPCDAIGAPVPLLTLASDGPSETLLAPLGGGTPTSSGFALAGPAGGAVPVGGAGGGSAGAPGGDGAPADDGSIVDAPAADVDAPVAAVPEASTWAMMIAGFGFVGAFVRRARRTSASGRTSQPSLRPAKRRRRARLLLSVGGGFASPMARAGAGGAIGGGFAKPALLGKAMMCVCPPALMIAAAATVPSARQAVHRVTASAVPTSRPAAATPTPPCDPTVATAASGTAFSRLGDQPSAEPTDSQAGAAALSI